MLNQGYKAIKNELCEKVIKIHNKMVPILYKIHKSGFNSILF